MNNGPDKLSPSQTLILDLLNTPPKRGWYGSELVTESNGKLARGTIYADLDALIEMHLVSEIDDQETGNGLPPRTKHFITEGGIRQLRFKGELSPRGFGGLTPSPA